MNFLFRPDGTPRVVAVSSYRRARAVLHARWRSRRDRRLLLSRIRHLIWWQGRGVCPRAARAAAAAGLSSPAALVWRAAVVAIADPRRAHPRLVPGAYAPRSAAAVAALAAR